MRRPVGCCLLVLAALLVTPSAAEAATSYFVRMRPAETAGLHATLAFDFTHSDTLSRNRATFVGFAHDGKADSATVEAGPGYGDLLSALNPAAKTTLENQYFYNSLDIPFDSLGSFATVRINLSEEGPDPAFAPDEFSMYFIGRTTGVPYPTADDLGTNALFAVDITGQAGGELTVFAPMVFIAPDTLAVDGGVLAVPVADQLDGRLRIRAVLPNPAVDNLRIDYDVPRPGGHVSLQVLDIAGRCVANVISATGTSGPASMTWALRGDHGNRVPPGVYFLQLRLAGQTVVRRVVLSR